MYRHTIEEVAVDSAVEAECSCVSTAADQRKLFIASSGSEPSPRYHPRSFDNADRFCKNGDSKRR
jgi:hypothetical protein